MLLNSTCKNLRLFYSKFPFFLEQNFYFTQQINNKQQQGIDTRQLTKHDQFDPADLNLLISNHFPWICPFPFQSLAILNSVTSRSPLFRANFCFPCGTGLLAEWYEF